MDPMVSARIPAELRDQVNHELRSIGSSPTELINRAYEFFLATKSLPDSVGKVAAGHRKLPEHQAAELRKSLEETTFPVPESYFEGKSYEQLLEKEVRESYEALA